MGKMQRLVNMIGKVFFWTATVLLGFINPLISVALVVVYYLPKIIQDICHSCNEGYSDRVFIVEEKTTYKTAQPSEKIDSFSKDVLEEMR